MLTLGIDTSGKNASVSVMDENNLYAEFSYLTRLTHSQVILPLVTEALEKIGKTLADIELIAVSNGPGSYTGLRIGIAAVKGMCFGKDTKCIGVSTLEALAMNVVFEKSVIFSTMKARNNVVYFGRYESNGETLKKLSDDVVLEIDEILKIAQEYEDKTITLVGDYADEIKNRLFENNGKVRTAPYFLNTPKASSICLVGLKNIENATNGEELQAVYLQETKAEKDKGFKG